MDSNTNFHDLTARSKYRYELALEYGISVRTIYRWMKKANFNIPHGLIDPYHLRKIYKEFGNPGDKNLPE
ncbi:MAG TPA: helix-turn-helix domain-containing protein [Bacteroidales bacterium]|nr:helix-turn-helix domain-containing protein [Bacteroidales bacterium]